MNCIFCHVFNEKKYLDVFFLLLESIFTYGNLDEKTFILVYTSTSFMNIIKLSNLFNDEKIKFEINDTCDIIENSYKAVLNFFKLQSSNNYKKILYLDTNILVKDDINKVFKICEEDILYVLEDGNINDSNNYWGEILFGNEIDNYNDKSAFTCGILLFNNCEKIVDLFDKINDNIIKTPYNFLCHEQPYIIYNAFKYNLYNNKILMSFAVKNNLDIQSDKVLHYFPEEPGIYLHKIYNMSIFLNGLYNLFMEKNLSNCLTFVSRERLENLYIQCRKFINTNYSFVECGVGIGGCLATMKFASGNNNKIIGLDSFEGMPNITKEDIGDYNKTCPITNSCKPGANLSGGIDNVYITFNILNLNMNNVTLLKGFFHDTLQNQENINNIGKIAVLRLDSDWYESTKICLEKLYNNVIEGGVIIIDDYGHFVGAKTATDEFREQNNIKSPLIQTDYTEHYWIKNTNCK